MSSRQERLLIFDAHAIIHRAWHALPPLKSKKGELVNALYGFLLIFLKAIKDLEPSAVVAAFDSKGPTFRHEAYEPYKAQRERQPDELYEQIPKVKETLEAFGVPVVEKQGFEADDLIGTMVEKFGRDKDHQKRETIIVSGDMDLLQLVDDQTKMLKLQRGVSETLLYDPAMVKECYGLEPEQIVDFKALRGDPSDNIPGVKGIGEKTATALLQEFGTLEGILKATKKKDLPKGSSMTAAVKEKLLEGEKDIEPNKTLVTIRRDVPLRLSLEECAWGSMDREKILKLFQAYGFQSLVGRIPEWGTEAHREDKSEKQKFGRRRGDRRAQACIVIENQQALEEAMEALKGAGSVVIETTDHAVASGTADAVYCCGFTNETMTLLKSILENQRIGKIGHDLKTTLRRLAPLGMTISGIQHDTMIASYLLDPGTRAHSLEALAFQYLGKTLTAADGSKGMQAALLGTTTANDGIRALCERVGTIAAIVPKLEKELEKQNLQKLYTTIELPLIAVLARMEEHGVLIDTAFLKGFSHEVDKDCKALEYRVYRACGKEFNLNSPQQLKIVLFEDLKISSEGIGRTKTGLSTASEELEKLRDRHPVVSLIMEYRELAKLQSTYLEALPKLVDPQEGRLHTTFNQTITATGRLSSSDPNLQNIPIRTPLGARVRRAFVAPRGSELVSLDYAQIELRIIASIANDEAMLAAFRRAEDIHVHTASKVYGVAPEKVTEEMRRIAKTVNFGIIYGLGPVGLAQATGVGREQAREFIDKYFALYKGVAQYINETKALAASLGYVETLFGRRRYLPDIHSGVQQLRAAAERMAVNMPVQGTQADLIKMAMIAIDREIMKRKLQSRMILQVHDELVFEALESEVESIVKLAHSTMVEVAKLKAPIEVHVKAGKNWGQMYADYHPRH